MRSAARSAIGMAEMLAHEIKNPLAGIRGAAQLIGMNLAPEDRDLADLIVAESRRIVELLDQRGSTYTTWEGWHQLDSHERALGEQRGRERMKVVPREDMVRISREDG